MAEEARSKGRKATTSRPISAIRGGARLIATAVDRLGPLGLLVNNASIHEKDSLATLTRRAGAGSWTS